MVLKISVLASGAVLLDGSPIALDQLAGKLAAAKQSNGIVWYYREAAAEHPPPQATSVLGLIVKHKLPVSLSSRPDFSDYVDSKGVSHPRTGQSAAAPETAPAGYEPRMPEVAAVPDIEAVFAEARKMAAGEQGPRGLVIVRPDRKYLVLPALAESPELTAMAQGLERLVPSAVRRNIAVIANTGFDLQGPGGAPNLAEVGKAIPFFGNLMGLSYLGHAVWIFEGQASAQAAGCRDADLLIVDSGMAPFLQSGWQDQVARVMRNANILIQDRSGFKLRFLRKVGESRERLEFPN